MCKSTIQPIPSKVDRMLLPMLLHYFNLFLSIPDEDSHKELHSVSHELFIILVAILKLHNNHYYLCHLFITTLIKWLHNRKAQVHSPSG